MLVTQVGRQTTHTRQFLHDQGGAVQRQGLGLRRAGNGGADRSDEGNLEAHELSPAMRSASCAGDVTAA
jgi:hypothetical protein